MKEILDILKSMPLEERMEVLRTDVGARGRAP